MWLKYCINNLKWQSIGIGKIFRIGTSLIPNSIRKLYFFPQKRSFFVIPKLFRGVVSHVPKEVHLFRGWVKFIGSNKYSKQIVIKLLSIHFSKWILFYFRLQLKKKKQSFIEKFDADYNFNVFAFGITISMAIFKCLHKFLRDLLEFHLREIWQQGGRDYTIWIFIWKYLKTF